MSLIPGNGVYVVQGEMSILLTAMKRGTRWSSHTHQDDENDILIKGFSSLKDVLNSVSDLSSLDPLHFLEPFLEVIKSEEITGPITSLALASINKFISYGLIDPNGKSVPAAVDRIADAVTHARFVGTDQSSDGVVLMRILQVLRSLVLSPIGVMLTNDSVCEIMLSCLRICFETRLSELLRRCAEHYLKDMVQLLFTRLPYFSEDLRKTINMKKLKMRSGSIDQSRGKRKSKSSMRKMSRTHSYKSEEATSQEKLTKPNILNLPVASVSHEAASAGTQPVVQTMEPSIPTSVESTDCNIVIEGQAREEGADIEQTFNTPELTIISGSTDNTCEIEVCEQTFVESKDEGVHVEKEESRVETVESPVTQSPDSDAHEWYNSQGVRFTPQDEGGPLVPYGLLCIRELFRFLVSLCNPLNKENTEFTIQVGLTLLTVALEVGADAIGKYSTLLAIVKDDLCRNFFMLLNSERLSIFATNLQVSFLLFESLRTHLKFQLELFLSRLSEIIVSDNPKITFEQKELALECVVQLWRIPGFVTELYLNYDCDLYCPNVYEDLTKLLSKNAFPVTGVYNTHLLSLDALLTIIDAIENHCNSRILNEKQIDSQKAPEDNFCQTSPPSGIISRQKVSQNIPSHEQLMAIKRKKKLLATGTEHFNVKPKKGIQFLQEHHILSEALDPQEIVQFLKENPHLDKKMIGEYISNRSNLTVLDAFVKSFDFTDTRIDEALRLYLETFRLPGESPLISLLMEHFADHWHKCNGEPFENSDAAFTLAYAVIMLNVDQHNHNVKRQNNPMTSEGFKKNLKNVNGGQNFDQDMLDDIYIAIKSEEIVMPAEQTGLVRENYLWKVLLRRGEGKDGVYTHAPNGLYDHDLFSLIWGPTVAALSFMFDKSNDPAIYQKSISGFRKCAMISAHYGMSNDFDNLMVSLCKFTMLCNSTESPDNLTISFGGNPKACLAANTVFNLAHRHGDIIREGWKHVLDCILQLYCCKLLPKILVEAEDFVEYSGKISLMREEIQLSQKTETGLLSSIYSYIALGAETSSHRVPSPEDQDHIRNAQACIRDCHIEHLITESKFLRSDSLHELVKALIHASYGPEGPLSSNGTSYNEDTAVFFLELLLKVVIQNRDRVTSIWASVRDHVYTLLTGAAACDHHFLVERCVVGLLRLAVRLMRREDMSPTVLQSLRMLLLLKATTLSRVSRQVSFGLYELLKTSAANIHSATDWAIIFTLLECVGAGAPPPRVVTKPSHHQTGAKSDGEVALSPRHAAEEDSGLGNERGCTSDSELSLGQNAQSNISSNTNSPELSPNTGGGWIMVGREGDIQPLSRPLLLSGADRGWELGDHDPAALTKCCESLAFLVRDVAHITPYNFENCVHCIRTFVEASLDSNTKHKKSPRHNKEAKVRRRSVPQRREGQRASSPTSAYDADESDSEELPSGYHQVPIQLLDLLHTLHTRTAQIHRWWAEESSGTEEALTSLWTQGWCPLLHAISRLCADTRKQVRMSAITYLQRALLVHDLQTLNADEWESCFNKVLFPLLSRLLEPIVNNDQSGLEETRMRAATLLSKVFLHHLTPLQSLPTFTSLWMRILDYMDKYMHVEKSDLLYEAIPESLKNMLLVMDSAGVFSTADSGRSALWGLTWDRINAFLPHLQSELFKSHPPPADVSSKPVRNETEPPPVVGPQQPQLQTRTEEAISQPQPSQQRLVLPTAILPRMGQLVSTPIGPPPLSGPSPPQPQEQTVISLPAEDSPPIISEGSQDASLPLYHGFSSLNSESSPTPSAQFFYQDMPQPLPVAQWPLSTSPPAPVPAGGGLLLNNTAISSLPIIAPPDS